MITFNFANGLELTYTDECAPVIAGINWGNDTLNPMGMAWRAVRQRWNEVTISEKPYAEKLRQDHEYVTKLKEVYDSINRDEVQMPCTVDATLTTKSMKSVNPYDGKEHDFTLYYINGTLVACKRDDGKIFKGIRLTVPYDEQKLLERLNVDAEANRRFKELKTTIEDCVKKLGFSKFYADIHYEDAEFNHRSTHFDLGEKFDEDEETK